MRKLNKQGFAISTIIYCILILAILIMGLLFSTMAFSKKTTDDFVYSIEKDLNTFANETYKDIAEHSRVYTTSIKNLNAYYTNLPEGNQIKSYLDEIAAINMYDISIDQCRRLVEDNLLRYKKAEFDLSYEENVDKVTGYIIDYGDSGRYILVIVAKGKIKTPVDCQNMFSFFKGDQILTRNSDTMGSDNPYVISLDTSNTTNMTGMFQNCTGLKSIDLQFDFSKVINMDRFLAGCNAITNVNGLQNQSLPELNSGERMFSECSSLTTLNISGFNAPSLINMKGMFNNCENLTGIDVSNFKTTKVTSMHNLFAGCTKLTTITGINTWQFTYAQTINFTSMFNNCQQLKTINLANFKCYASSLDYMFRDCKSLEDVNIGNINYEKTTKMEYMFNNCSKLKSIYLGEYEFDTSVISTYNNMFNNCNELRTININAINSSNYGSLNITPFLSSRLSECGISPGAISFPANKL